MERWVGRVAVVTGASAGIGAAVAVALADAGLKVVGLARRPNLVDELSKKVTGPGCIVARKCDVGNAEEVETAFQYVEESLGGTDLLVNNAGVLLTRHITEVGASPMSSAEVMSVIDINLKGTVLCTRLAVASMKRRAVDGHVININSVAGHYVPFHHEYNLYPSTKHAITAFTESLRNELVHFGSKIKTTSLSPGLVETELSGASELDSSIPRLQPQDIADSVLYVISTPPHVDITEITVQPVMEKKF